MKIFVAFKYSINWEKKDGMNIDDWSIGNGIYDVPRLPRTNEEIMGLQNRIAEELKTVLGCVTAPIIFNFFKI